MFTKACEYGLKAAIFIAQESANNRRCSLKQISDHISSPSAFTAKILQQLTRNEVISSVKGPNGGFFIPADKLSEIKLQAIVDAIDGSSIYQACGLGLEQCDANKPCPLHNQFVSIRDELKNMLKNTSLLDLSLELNKGLTFLNR